jgi:hypothetical protein
MELPLDPKLKYLPRFIKRRLRLLLLTLPPSNDNLRLTYLFRAELSALSAESLFSLANLSEIEG